MKRIAEGTMYLPRDIMMMAMMGTLFEIRLKNGTRLWSQRQVTTQAQALLDTISQTPGAMLVRGATEWIALLPGAVGDVLTTQGPGLIPQWQPGGGGVDYAPGFGPFDPPSIGTFDTYAGNASWALDDTRGLIGVPNAGATEQLSVATTPRGTATQWIAGMHWLQAVAGIYHYNGFGLVAHTAGDGQYYALASEVTTPGPHLYQELRRYTDLTHEAQTYGGGDYYIPTPICWFKFVYDPDTGALTGYVSQNGYAWAHVGGTTLTQPVTDIGIHVLQRNNTYIGAAAATYWNAA